MTDFARIKANVELMASKGAPPEHIDDYLHQEGYTPDKFKARVKDMSDAGVIDTALKYSAGSGVANLLDLPGAGLTAAYNLLQMGKGLATGKPQDYPTSDPDTLSFANRGFRKAGLIDDAYAPTTSGGKIVDLTTQALTGGGVNPAAIARNLTRGMVKPVTRDIAAATATGLGAGIGNVATENIDTGNKTLDNGLKMGATLLGGAIPGGTIAARGTGGDRAATAIKGVTPEQLAAARELKRMAASKGTPITDFEAIQSQTGLNPKQQTLQRLAEQSDAAANTLTPIMQNRPSANQAMIDQAIGQIAPPNSNPSTLAGQLQAAALKSISETRKAGNREAEPFYTASSNNLRNGVTRKTWDMLTADDGVMAALNAVKKDPYSGLQDAKNGSMAWLDQAKKHLDSQIEVAKRSGDNYTASQMKNAREKIVSAADSSFPDYAKARGIVAQNMQENVTPMEQGQIGKLSRSDKFENQSEEFLPKNPADVTPEVIRQTSSKIGEQNPDILSQFLAQDLRRKYDASARDTLAGEMPTAGARFAKDVAGTNMQEQNLIEAIRSSGADVAPFQDALSVFRAQGYKPAVNSATQSNAQEASALNSGLVSALMGRIRPQIDQWRNGMATADIAKAIAAQDNSGPMRIEELARANGVYSPMKQQMLINMLLANQPAQ